MNLDDLYHIADVENIEIIPFPLPKTKSLSIQTDDFDLLYWHGRQRNANQCRKKDPARS